jgi:hypothetical protein
VDEHHFSSESDGHDEGVWSTPEEERTFRVVRDLLMEMNSRGSGIFIMPVQAGMSRGGAGSEETYGFDGWVVGEFSADGALDLAVGPWLDQVVAAARAAGR